MRGNQRRLLARVSRIPLGSIPAHAGKPPANGRTETRQGVYPRPCGETDSESALRGAERVYRLRGGRSYHTGLSPPMRGNPGPNVASLESHGEGSIPAHAGKPSIVISMVSPGTNGSIPAHAGKPLTTRGFCLRGSIPAHAGNPLMHLSRGLSPPMRGNPCGRDSLSSSFRPGLSPPMRGNRGCARVVTRNRVYPRPCGETELYGTVASSWTKTRVYPRPCGETSASGPLSIVNRPCGITLEVTSRVYPRPCGETQVSTFHTRSKRPCGETVQSSRVYPRPCGETFGEETSADEILRIGVYPRPCGETSRA